MRWFAIVAVVAFASSARADELDDLFIEANGLVRPSPRPIDHDQVWYGWQTMMADAVLVSGWALYPKWSGFKGDGTLLLVDILGYTLISPLIDALHENVRSESLALRLGLPLVGALLGLGIGTQLPFFSNSLVWGPFDGALFGAGAAAIIDDVAFAWTKREPARTVSWKVSPFGVRGTF